MRITRRIAEEAKRFGSEINQQKTSYMIMADTQGETDLYITVQMQGGQEHRFERVKEFTYLGVKIEESEKDEQEMEC